jgi:NADPH2:quinone reductase
MSNHAIHIHHTGGPEVLQWEEVPLPALGATDVRLRHTAVGLNFIDVYHRTGLYPLPLPAVPGMEAAGVVEAVGEAVSDVKVGDRVAYAGVMGAYAEQRVIASDRVVRLPEGVSDLQAASLMLKGMTAQFLLRSTYRVQKGDTILVHAAAGGVGLLLCQWASHLGATVIGTVGSPQKAELARAHGCHHTILYREVDFVPVVRKLTDGKGVPVVYDSVGRDTFLKSLDCLRPRGLMVSFGQSSGAIAPLEVGMLSAKGSLFLTRPTLMTYIASRAELVHAAQELFEVVAQGVVKGEPAHTWPLKDASRAHHALQQRTTHGSSVLLP